MKFLAIKYQRIFPDILENLYDRQKFSFRHTKTQRAEASFKAFIEGLFGENAYRYVEVPPPAQNDTLLRPYDSCPAWQEQKRDREDSEKHKFEKTQIFQQVQSDVSARLGFKYPLKIDQLKDIFSACAFELAWKLDSPSAWCTVSLTN